MPCALGSRLSVRWCASLKRSRSRCLPAAHRQSHSGANVDRTHWRSLVAKEVDLFESLGLDELQTVRLVPAVREDVKRDLAADRECEAVVCEFFAKHIDEILADVVDLALWELYL